MQHGEFSIGWGMWVQPNNKRLVQTLLHKQYLPTDMTYTPVTRKRGEKEIGGGMEK